VFPPDSIFHFYLTLFFSYSREFFWQRQVPSRKHVEDKHWKFTAVVSLFSFEHASMVTLEADHLSAGFDQGRVALDTIARHR